MNTKQHTDIQPFMLWLMALACGLCAGANYFAQPLIHSIQIHFAVTPAQAQFTITCAQASYALGLLFLVPLGDLVKKHLFIPTLMALAALGLLISGFAPNIYVLWIGTIITGVFTVAAQVLIPLSTAIAAPEKTGAVVGFLMTGLLVGILLSTSLAGLLSHFFAWNAVYILSAMVLFSLALLLKPRLPILPQIKLSYTLMFQSMGRLLIEEKRLVLRAIIGAMTFASMSILFATISVLLAQPPFELADFYIGIIGLTGLIGALFAQYAGKLADRGYTKQLTLSGAFLVLSSWFVLYFSQWYLMAFIIGFAVINLGLSMQHTTNLNIIYKLRDDAKARINSIYMTFYFIGAASGSAMGIWAWNHGGWMLACVFGLGLATLSGVFVCLDYFKYERLKI